MKKINQYKKKFFLKLIDKMIPKSKNKLLPNASKVINIDKFINYLFENKKFKNKLNELFNKESKNKNFNYQQLALKVFSHKIIEDDIAKDLLKFYFSSKIVQKRLKITINKNKNEEKDNRSLVNLLKNSSLRYKRN